MLPPHAFQAVYPEYPNIPDHDKTRRPNTRDAIELPPDTLDISAIPWPFLHIVLAFGRFVPSCAAVSVPT